MTMIQQDVEFIAGAIYGKKKQIRHLERMLQQEFDASNIFDVAERQAYKDKIVSLRTHIEDLEGEINLLKVRGIIEEFGEVDDYDRCEELLSLIKPFGYTFDYYLDAEINNLRKIQ